MIHEERATCPHGTMDFGEKLSVENQKHIRRRVFVAEQGLGTWAEKAAELINLQSHHVFYLSKSLRLHRKVTFFQKDSQG
ncbi:hypothetical protein CDAR_423941 [Caerostris darwini]|uniref:Uncharacterized protein n=1 Tax=Caerostris darwini TaxID=1538125 RepID=A0AAV4VD90_9ARAC|nr:hypothetical protein CDAR_423941 [Caerostris darwini]